MSLPAFSTQQLMFGIGSLADNLFPATNRFRLFAEKVWPLLAQARPDLETMYCADNGRPAAEPVVLAGVCLLQFLERVPDRQAMGAESDETPLSCAATVDDAPGLETGVAARPRRRRL